MNGWRYEWIDELPIEVYETLMAMLTREYRTEDDPLAALVE